MLEQSMKQQLKAYLENLKTDVQLVLSLDDSDTAQKLHELAYEIAELNDKVSVIENNNASARKPVMQVVNPTKQTSMSFAGLPMGHEFTSLVLALLHSGGHPMKLEQAVIDQIAALDQDIIVETFISLSCQNCPDVVQAFNMMAAINPRIKSSMIDGAAFQAEVTERNIMAVPTVYVNGEVFGQGRMSLTEILNKLDTGAAKKAAASLNDKAPFDVLVVGGGPAGASAAIYAARKGIRTGVVAERFGGQVMDTMSIENFISVQETTGPHLAASLEEHVKQYNVDIMSEQRVKNIVAAADTEDGYAHIYLESGAILKSRSVIISTGARWREMNVPGEQEYRNKGVAYCPHCDGPLFKGKRTAVIGGGNSGIEAAIDLAGIVEHVTVLEFADTLRADQVLINKAESMPNIDIIKMAQTTEVVGDGTRVTGISYKDRNTDEIKHIELAGIFVQIGLVPNTEWLKESTVALTPRGEIEIGAHGNTNVNGIFAAGDVTTVPFKQIIIAMGEGAKASLGAFDYLIRTPAPIAK
ncbi:alkyl hydroperoxide reductase subunit F [Photobacterium phosphoreum]|uniref:alkyl hydroperoxide reductase subunit F n=1 Tax=Photobacterium phosphoreum TaxID=659 RepID=UPI000D168F1C|nr:alkyl hydroperoxide reductase subunit F [Photobacterium phosphoreum]MCD9463999.1 alkyl hydroperoxide reductase subunit F [Photobacterium phosphoreum]MCD9474990.1 alkyl hydroperoxide reductase subunit F [Photobacterium phosphoreum]MCD9479395.1 alkyl hydroperoxide reductase subunit F [Photobacterium phosphoreum]MCD9501989.1 alkyl hydroperoxide reductase subunit F [Photobacterium phosphoreum]MCD9506605.1 alkyl hydroperoxide reductase subunit F [Photobacterium phosphoreum]